MFYRRFNGGLLLVTLCSVYSFIFILIHVLLGCIRMFQNEVVIQPSNFTAISIHYFQNWMVKWHSCTQFYSTLSTSVVKLISSVVKNNQTSFTLFILDSSHFLNDSFLQMLNYKKVKSKIEKKNYIGYACIFRISTHLILLAILLYYLPWFQNDLWLIYE